MRDTHPDDIGEVVERGLVGNGQLGHVDAHEQVEEANVGLGDVRRSFNEEPVAAERLVQLRDGREHLVEPVLRLLCRVRERGLEVRAADLHDDAVVGGFDLLGDGLGKQVNGV